VPDKPGGTGVPPGVWTGAVGTPTRLVLVRHGQTEMSARRRYSGRGNPPLSELGLRQAKSAAGRLATMDSVAAGATAVVSSPLLRARQTADEVAAAMDLPVVSVAGLIETDFGRWEGLTFAEAAARDPELHRSWLSDPSVPAPEGESFDQVHRRVRTALDELVAEYGGSTVVVVSHVTPIKTLLRIGLEAGPSMLFRLHLDLASLSVVEFYPDGHASVRLVNDTGHLG
jgi:probable phosphoglycerate mutase